ncbi:PAS domain-containing protein [Paenibacillus monticola]|uniref:PAS domain-containing protein n=1 Tax=Paenibacillus monticola TaxID=2666075 RepID=A0A7X2H1E5_9BACL|nr:PAS domain-containing protein [Paenibacillus monticola]MRN51779.1 hypothetical protein [Paenibacillus monticola]
MPESLSTSITNYFDTLSQNVLLINSSGIILYTNNRWRAYRKEYGLSPLKEWVGVNCFELLQELITEPTPIAVLRQSLQSILQGERLVFSSEFSMPTNKGLRRFRSEIFPLISGVPSARELLVISLFDAGAVKEQRTLTAFRPPSASRKHSHKLIPICASCKSIRNAKEEWDTIEHFLQQHLSMQFTHDICPDCIRLLYPKYAGAFTGSTGH